MDYLLSRECYASASHQGETKLMEYRIWNMAFRYILIANSNVSLWRDALKLGRSCCYIELK